jgi:hypothetical protein
MVVTIHWFYGCCFRSGGLNSPQPVLVILGRVVRPVPHDGADDRSDRGGVCRKAKVGKLDVDSNVQTAGRYQLRNPHDPVFKEWQGRRPEGRRGEKADVKRCSTLTSEQGRNVPVRHVRRS